MVADHESFSDAGIADHNAPDTSGRNREGEEGITGWEFDDDAPGWEVVLVGK